MILDDQRIGLRLVIARRRDYPALDPATIDARFVPQFLHPTEVTIAEHVLIVGCQDLD